MAAVCGVGVHGVTTPAVLVTLHGVEVSVGVHSVYA